MLTDSHQLAEVNTVGCIYQNYLLFVGFTYIKILEIAHRFNHTSMELVAFSHVIMIFFFFTTWSAVASEGPHQDHGPLC